MLKFLIPHLFHALAICIAQFVKLIGVIHLGEMCQFVAYYIFAQMWR